MPRPSLLVASILLPALLAALLGGLSLRRAATTPPPPTTTCVDERGQVVTHVLATPLADDFVICIQRQAALFLSRDVADTRDLIKAFLTLLTAVLVASITFSEKIVGINTASFTTRGLMIGCWLMLLAAIIAAGVALAFMTLASGWATYAPHLRYRIYEYRAVYFLVSAGLAFAIGLALLLAAGILSVIQTGGKHAHPSR